MKMRVGRKWCPYPWVVGLARKAMGLDARKSVSSWRKGDGSSSE